MVGGCHFQAFWVGSKPVRSNFLHIFGVRKKVKKKKSKKNRFLSVKIGFFRGKIGFYPKKFVFIGKIGDFSPIVFSRFFHPNIFSSTTEIRFFSEKSAEIGDFFVHAHCTYNTRKIEKMKLSSLFVPSHCHLSPSNWLRGFPYPLIQPL